MPFIAVKDVATRFADGRLSAAKLALWNEEEVAENLIAVRGIGPVSNFFYSAAKCTWD